jgi:hypothetical protein
MLRVRTLTIDSLQTLEAYEIQLRHLQKELDLVQQEFDDWEKLSKDRDGEPPRRR